MKFKRLLIVFYICLITFVITKITEDIDEDDMDITPLNSIEKMKDNKESLNMNFLQVKSKNLNSVLNLNQNKQEIDEAPKKETPPKFKVYTEAPKVETPEKIDKSKKYMDNLIAKLQAGKHFKREPTEGYIEKFRKAKHVQPGQDTFLGFLKYMSDTANKINNIMEKEKTHRDPYANAK